MIARCTSFLQPCVTPFGLYPGYCDSATVSTMCSRLPVRTLDDHRSTSFDPSSGLTKIVIKSLEELALRLVEGARYFITINGFRKAHPSGSIKSYDILPCLGGAF